MKRVVVTGMGIVSCLGNDTETVLDALKEGRSGIRFKEDYKEIGFRSQVAGSVDIDLDALLDRKTRRFMADSAGYAYVAMRQAIEDAGLTHQDISNPRTGIVAGSGGSSPSTQIIAADVLRAKGIKRVGPFVVPRSMSSTVAACLATPFGIKGINYSIASACATSSHCIGHAMEQIQLGKQDIMFAGGGEEERWELTMGFDAMGALSTKYNDTPEKASRPFDVTRDGFVIAGGGGIVVLEEMEHAISRGAKIYAEVVGYGTSSDGFDMVVPSGEGAVRCMRQAIETVHEPIDYINAHGTSTPAGDVVELKAIAETFQDKVPPISSTKSLSGHSLGAAGVHEAIYSLLMMREGFIAHTINTENLEEVAKNLPIVRERTTGVTLNTVMSNSFGFGGTNACLVFQRVA